jgi:3-methyl-2-oxobutanoate hydroxymethyltransferase
MLGISPGKLPKFVKNFMVDGSSIEGAIKAYVKDVKSGLFPGSEYSFAS